MEPVHRQYLLAQQAEAGEREGGGVQRVASHEGLGGRVGGHAGEDRAYAPHAEPRLVREVVGVGVGLDGGVDAVEHPANRKDFLGGGAFLGGRRLEDDAARNRPGAPAFELVEGEEGADGVARHDVVPAAVADARKRVVFGEDGDRRGGRIGVVRVADGAGELGAQGGLHPVNAHIGLDAVGAQQVGDRGDREALLVSDLGVVVDGVRKRDDLAREPLDGCGEGFSQLGG